MSIENPGTFFAGNEKRYEKWKEPVEVINFRKDLGLETQQDPETTLMSAEQSIDIDNRALRNADCPNIVFGRPHAGEFVPKEIYDRMTQEGIRRTLALIDAGTEDIFRTEKIPSVGAKISRFAVDPNRSPLMDVNPDNPNTPGKVLWYKGIFSEEMYKEGQEPSKEEVESWVERFYYPYYNAMMATTGSLTDRRQSENERVLVIDGHTFPVTEEFLPFFRDQYKIKNPEDVLPMFILGDQDGKTCDEDIRNAFMTALEKNFSLLSEEERHAISEHIKGGLVKANFGLKGVHNVKFWGQQREGVNAIQVEMNEEMYAHGGKYNQENMAIVKKLVEKSALDIDSLLKNKQ
jgi:N-formylglutamate amidohydrolase